VSLKPTSDVRSSGRGTLLRARQAQSSTNASRETIAACALVRRIEHINAATRHERSTASAEPMRSTLVPRFHSSVLPPEKNASAPASENRQSAARAGALPPEVSIIIPACNEEKRLPPTLERIEKYLDLQSFTAEILVVDDGSSDATAQVVMNWQARMPGLRLISNGKNRGKGYSVRHGMLEAAGRVTLFTDADLSAPIEEADKLLAALDKFDVAIGSRALDRTLIATRQSGLRELAGRSFNWAVRFIVGVPFADTQCGFKAFRRERARILFEQQRIERFGFDPELLFLARRHGLNVAEIPVRWAHDAASRVHVVGDGLRMVGELVAIRWNSLVGRYASKSGPSKVAAGSAVAHNTENT
jgi:hypothetical protein